MLAYRPQPALRGLGRASAGKDVHEAGIVTQARVVNGIARFLQPQRPHDQQRPRPYLRNGPSMKLSGGAISISDVQPVTGAPARSLPTADCFRRTWRVDSRGLDTCLRGRALPFVTVAGACGHSCLSSAWTAASRPRAGSDRSHRQVGEGASAPGSAEPREPAWHRSSPGHAGQVDIWSDSPASPGFCHQVVERSSGLSVAGAWCGNPRNSRCRMHNHH